MSHTPTPTTFWQAWFTRIDRVCTAIASVALILMLIITIVSVTGRYLFNNAIPDDIVMNELLMPWVVFLPLAYVHRLDEHIVVTLFSDKLPPSVQPKLIWISNALGTAVIGLIAYAVWGDFWEAWMVKAHNEGYLELPNYYSKFVLFVGIALYALRMALATLGLVHTTPEHPAPAESEPIN